MDNILNGKRNLPVIDQKRPEELQIATFAMG